MRFDLLNYLNCLIEGVVLLMLWRIADDRPFRLWHYALSYVLLCGISIPVTFVDSVFFSILPVNFLLIFLCMWAGFRWHIKEAFFHTLFQFLLLLYIQCIVNTFVPDSLFMTNAGNFIANGINVTVALLLLLIARRYRFSELLRQHATVVWTFFFILCVPEIAIVQAVVSQKDSPSKPIMIIFLLLQILYTALIVLCFSLVQRHTKRRQLANTEKYITEMNEHLEKSRRSMHDFNKHIRYLRNAVAVGSADEALVSRIDDYCGALLDTYEKEELLLQLDNPVLRALLYGRRTQAALHHIEFILDASAVLPAFPLKNHQIVEVFDNLMDNAFECVAELPENTRWIRVTLSATPQSNGTVEQMLCIENPAPTADVAAIFRDKPYTSKGGTHRGIGLRHVSQLVADTGGDLVLHHQHGIFKVKVIYATA